MKKNPDPLKDQGISPGFRRYLYGTAAFTGAAIMIIEILGAKMLAPYVGTSHFVWTAQIAVTLLALAVGYYTGGRLVDRSPRLGQLYLAILLAGVYLCFAVAVIEPVADWCLEMQLAVGSLLASTFLFFVPLALLAMVGPFLARVLTDSLAGVGANVGRLIAVSTVGSFVGTILISYVLLPLVRNSLTMLSTAMVLIILGASYLCTRERRKTPFIAAACLISLICGLSGLRDKMRFRQSIEVERKNSNFGLLQVVYSKGGPARFLLNDLLMQNVYDASEKKSLVLFSYVLHGLAHGYTSAIQDALCVGLGVGIVPMQLAKEGTRVDVVEINPAIVPLAQKHFDLEPERLRIVIGDGRHYVKRCTNRYDTVLLDAFLGDAPPSHLMTREAFEEIRRILKRDGTLVINSFGDLSPGKDFSVSSMEKTLKAVFRNVRIHYNRMDRGFQNVFFVASDQEALHLTRLPNPAEIHPTWRVHVMATFATGMPSHPERGIVLTDDYNPVEFRDAGNREQFRRTVYANARGL